MYKDKASEQLEEYRKTHLHSDVLTTATGAPIGDKTNVLTAGSKGSVLLRDFVFLEENAHFNREKIAERVMHAKGAGAFGYFEVKEDITQYCKAKVFSKIGQKTSVAVRFSTVVGEAGSADTVRSPRGFAIKFYTKDGIWDLVGNNHPVFFIRDPFQFPSLAHSHKRNPVTNLVDLNMTWDFLSLRPETTNQVFLLYSDKGIPNGHRHMDGYGIHAFKLVNHQGNPVYCKFELKTNQGITNLTQEKASELVGEDPDYATRDLYNAIAAEKYPSWDLSIQVMTMKEAENYGKNTFDSTKTWDPKVFPPKFIGTLVLNKNPENYFQQIEQLAFSPAHLVPGIEPSPDKLLQGRMFAYTDTQRHRLGPNFLQIPVNSSTGTREHNYQRSGQMSVKDNQGGTPNYYPNSFNGPAVNPAQLENPELVDGYAARYETADDDNFSQSRILWNEIFSNEEKKRFVKQLGSDISKVYPVIQQRVLNNLQKVHAEIHDLVRNNIK